MYERSRAKRHKRFYKAHNQYIKGTIMTNQVNVNALLVRAFKTFLQGSLSVLALNLVDVTNITTGKAVLIGAVAAGISAVANLFLQPQEAK